MKSSGDSEAPWVGQSKEAVSLLSPRDKKTGAVPRAVAMASPTKCLKRGIQPLTNWNSATDKVIFKEAQENKYPDFTLHWPSEGKGTG